MLVRLQKYLADSGVASRRKAESLILDGQVSVNGITVTELGTKVDDEIDKIFCRGAYVRPKSDFIYIMLHKPEKYISTVSDQFNRPTIMDLINEKDYRLFPVGRLDYDTSGLLIMTNDGNLAHKLTHPKHNIEKVYVARICNMPTKEELERFRKGLLIDGYKTELAKIEIVDIESKVCTVKITIKEGKNRQVRKMCDEIGHKVLSLKRIATGKLYLGPLQKGSYRRLTDKEIDYLRSL